MKHFMLSDKWEFSSSPFPAYRCELWFGQNKHDKEFLPVKDVKPEIWYTVYTKDGENVIYSGKSRDAAEKSKSHYDTEQEKVAAGKYFERASLIESLPILPENEFRVIKTKEKGTILVVPGPDTSNRCLLFVGCDSGFRGGMGIEEDGTTCSILKTCEAENNLGGRIEVVALLEVGQTLAFYSTGRRTDEVHLYTFVGHGVRKSYFSRQEWEARNDIAFTPEEAETL